MRLKALKRSKLVNAVNEIRAVVQYDMSMLSGAVLIHSLQANPFSRLCGIFGRRQYMRFTVK